ncbi:actin cytoskeleton organization protein [Amanita rubescens]|nr:actin cytoskeleton organization protein [Amanita rubescens]
MSAAALDRQIRPIYDALDTGSNKSALVACNKLLKKYPKSDLLKSLKALALVRSQKVEESLVLCDEVLESKPTTDGVLTAMMHVLRGLGRQKDMVAMFEDAYKQQPNNEELGAQTFFANVRATNWKAAQQIATRMHKQFQDSRYLYWTVMCTILQAKESSTPPEMRSLLYKLAHRLLESCSVPSFLSAERFCLHLSVLQELRMLDEAQTLVDSDIGKAICSSSLVCNQMRRDIWRLQGRTSDEGQRAESMILKNDRNWLEFLAVIDASFSPGSNPSNEERTKCTNAVKKAEELFTNVANEDGARDRSGLLALLELEKRARHYGVSSDPGRLLHLMQQYFEKVGDKACCFEDLKPYQILEGEDSIKWTSFLESVPDTFTNAEELRRLTNVYKLLRHKLPAADVTTEAETRRAALYTKTYLSGLQIGLNLPSSELQPADDLAILAGNSLVMLWKLTNDEGYLFSAVTLLEFALTRSAQSFQCRLILIRIYRLLGASSLALEHYRALHVKQIQHDTLSHLVLSRASTFSLSSVGDLTLASECLEATQIYISNSQETGDYIVRAFTTEKYSQIPEFITFEERLDNSLQRDIIKMEHLRMRLTHEPISSDVVDMELIELKFVFDRTHHDNRDFAILSNYQPQVMETFNEQTLLLQKELGNGWLRAFLRIYIKLLQQASDLDDTVEEKLLIGDRPKQSLDPQKRLPLKDRLLTQSSDELAELTEDERSLVDYADSMAEWLEPYHNYTRPPPHVVLAEASKQTELKTGHPLKGVEIQPLDGASNGNGRKNEEPPLIQDTPALVANYFKDMRTRIFEAQDNLTITELLHRATIAQEAFILFIVETLRFKSSSVVKVNKLGPLVANFKAVKTEGLALLKDISASLIEKSEQCNSAESRKVFASACSQLAESEEIGHEFVQSVNRKVCESQKKVLEAVGKGMVKLCTTYAS